jgi:hypothetical protein
MVKVLILIDPPIAHISEHRFLNTDQRFVSICFMGILLISRLSLTHSLAYTTYMKANSLAAKNRYLIKDASGKSIIRNAATSTSIETGKGSDKYVTRCSRSGKPVVTKNPGLRKKQAS